VKALRIVQIVALVLVAVYLVLFHYANPETVRLPLLISVPPSLVVVLAVVLAWLAGWLPGRARLWGLERRLRRAEADRQVLASEIDRARRGEPSDPVIPDRDAAGVRRGDDPTDYL
jgi:uncharacterized integral membrane protein